MHTVVPVVDRNAATYSPLSTVSKNYLWVAEHVCLMIDVAACCVMAIAAHGLLKCKAAWSASAPS